ncbi:MAG: PAS domain S-box protein [Bacteroidota bacterium]
MIIQNTPATIPILTIDKAVFYAMPGNSILVATDPPVYTILAVTEGMVQQSGIPLNKLLNQPFFKPFPANPSDPDDTNAVIQNIVLDSFQHVIKYKETHQLPAIRYDLRNDDGEFLEYYWSVKNKPVLDDKGEVQYIIHSSENISDKVRRSKQEERIIELEKSHHLFMQAPAIIGFFKGRENIIEVANEAMFKLFDKTDDIIGKPLLEALQGINENFVDIINKVRQTGDTFLGSEVPTLIQRAGVPEMHYFDLVCQPVFDKLHPEEPGVFAMSHDVTELVVAKKKIQESEAKYRTLFDTMDQGFCIIEVLFDSGNKPYDYRFLEINRVFEEQTGLKDAAGKTMLEMVPGHESHWFENYGKVALSGESSRFIEKSDALGRWFDVYAVKIGNSESRKVAVLFKDITARKNIEEATRQSEYNLRSMIMQSPVAMSIFTGPEFTVEVANDRILELWGKSREDIINQPIFSVLTDAREQGFEKIMQQVYTTGERFVATEQPVLLPRNGIPETFFVNFVYEPFRGIDGIIKGVMFVGIEVTQQVKARKQIEENEEKLRIAIEGGELGTYDYFPETSELIWSDKTKEHFGLPPDTEVNIEYFLRGVHIEDSNSTLQAFLLALNPDNKGRYENEYRTVGKLDGKIRWVKSKGKISFNAAGKPVRLTGVTQDITKQKELIASLQIQSLVLERMDEGVSVSDENGVILFTNPAEDKMFGYEKGELIGQHVSVQNAYDPEENTRIINEVIDELKTNGFWSGEFHNRKKDGTPFYSYSYITAVPVEGKNMFVCVQRDITLEKKNREILIESEHRFRNLADQVPMMVFIIEPTENASVSYWNKQWLSYTGQTLQTALGIAWNGIIHPDDIQIIVTIYQEAYVNQSPYFIPAVRLKNKDGNFRWHMFKGNPRFLSNGEFVGFVGIGFDIHEQKLAEEKLAYRTALLEAHNQASLDGILLVDARGKIISYNHRFIEIWNMPLSIVKAKDDNAALEFAMSQLVYPQQFIDKVRELYLKPNESMLDDLHFLNGKIIERLGYPVIGDDGTYYAWSWTFKDITKQRQYEAVIKESEEKFRTLTETLPQLVWMTNEKGNYEYASGSWEDYSGLIIEHDNNWVQIIHPDDAINISKAWDNSLITGEKYVAEGRLKNKYGEYRWHYVQGVPIRDKEGKIIKWIGAFTDIDDQKTLSQKLENLVAERTKELALSNEDLQQFAHVASHDLKEPVRKVKIFSNRLKDEFEEVLPGKAMSYIDKIEMAANRMYDMIDGVLQFSSFDAMKQLEDNVDLNEIFVNIQTDLEILIHQKDAIIELKPLPRITGSPVLLNQLFYNLLNNSLKFSKQNERPIIQISGEQASDAEIIKSGLPPNDYLRITISDNGIGFDQDFSERIFKIFTRLNAKDKYEGTGLGLSLCRRIAERHGGSIEAFGKENEGAIFHVFLPIRQA